MGLRVEVTWDEMMQDMAAFLLEVQEYISEVVEGKRSMPVGGVFSITELQEGSETDGRVETWFAGADFAVEACLDHLDEEVAHDYIEASQEGKEGIGA